MSEPTGQFEGQQDLQLSNTSVSQSIDGTAFRNVVPSTSTAMPVQAPVAAPAPMVAPPPLPPKPDMTVLQPNYGVNQGFYGMGNYGMGGYGGYGYNNMGGGYGVGMGGMAPYGGYNRFGGNMYMGDVESRFVQMAEENSRHAFDSIQGVVNAVGSVAMMLESTFFALTSSFRAILGVAENFGRLRSLFGQFWSTFAVFRTLNWLIRKLLVMLGIRTECEFKAWAEAVSASASPADAPAPAQPARPTTWPVMLFFGIIAAAPYIVHKMLTGLTTTINESLNDPKTWQSPLRAITDYAFQATNAQELSFNANQTLFVAPQHLQGNLWTSGWLMASADMQHAGLVPVNYVKIVKPVAEDPKKEEATMNRYFGQQA